MPIHTLNLSEVKQKVGIAEACFRSNDSNLLAFDELLLPERPISHRLGFYLQYLFISYNVDCEYNKHLGGAKIIDQHTVIPDILVHKRKVDEDNLLAVEVKARRNMGEVLRSRDRQLVLGDYDQLKKYTKQDGVLKYKWGVFILVLFNETKMEWFQDGTEMQPLLIASDSVSFG